MPPGAPEIPAEALERVLAAYPQLGCFEGVTRNGLSANTAACLFRTSRGAFFAKRYDPLQREPAGLVAEHAIIRELRAHGYRTPELYANRHGETLTWEAERPYALFALARGEDRYRDVSVYAPFRVSAEAASAGAWLARFHLALRELPRLESKPIRGITARYRWLLAPSSTDGLEALLAEAPILRGFLAAQPEFPELRAYVETRHARLAPMAMALPAGVIHGDFIKRNLFFEGDAVSDVLDFDLWNVGPWLYDLALGMLPCGFDWPALARGEAPRYSDVKAFLEGYRSVRMLTDAEEAALPIVMETARVENYLSLVAMALRQDDADRAMVFWGFIVTLMKWFRVNVEWWTSLGEGGPA